MQKLLEIEIRIWNILYDLSLRYSKNAEKLAFTSLFVVYQKLLRRSEKWSRERLEEFQSRKLCELVYHAYKTVPFYGYLLGRNDINIQGLFSLDSIKKIPTLSKKYLRTFPQDDRVAKDISPKRFYLSRTSGSQGEPFVFINDKITYPFSRALREERLYRKHGATPSFKILLVDPDFKSFPEFNLRISIFDLLKNPRQVIQTLSQYRDFVLMGYASGLRELAFHLERQEYKLTPRVILSFAEQLSDNQRIHLEKIFLCDVFNVYGATEMGIIGQECELKDGFHVNEEAVVVEILPEDANIKSPGSVIVTSLLNKAMPFIRYRLGDIGWIDNEACRCGIQSIKLHILGRNSVIFKTSGRVIHEFEFNNVLKNFTNTIDQFQVVQIGEDQIKIRVVGPFFDEHTKTLLIKQLNTNIDETIQFSIEKVEKIQLSKRGKALIYI